MSADFINLETGSRNPKTLNPRNMLGQWFFAIIITVSVGSSQRQSNGREDYKFGSILTDNDLKACFNGKSDQNTRPIQASKKPVMRNKKKAKPALAHPAVADTLVILLFNREGIYAYPGTNIKAGRKYTYPELRMLLNGKKSSNNLSVIIKPCVKSTYKNTVSMLDEMKQAGITRYALVDITREEEDYLQKLPRKL
jgi:hypothetical protein